MTLTGLDGRAGRLVRRDDADRGDPDGRQPAHPAPRRRPLLAVLAAAILAILLGRRLRLRLDAIEGGLSAMAAGDLASACRPTIGTRSGAWRPPSTGWATRSPGVTGSCARRSVALGS